jgi:hypothetical protein
MPNRFEQVDFPQPDALNLVLTQTAARQDGRVVILASTLTGVGRSEVRNGPKSDETATPGWPSGMSDFGDICRLTPTYEVPGRRAQARRSGVFTGGNDPGSPAASGNAAGGIAGFAARYQRPT